MQNFTYYVERQLLLKQKNEEEKKSPPDDLKKSVKPTPPQSEVECDAIKDKPLPPLLIGMKMLYLRSHYI